jgi:hypothetical protein
MINTKPVELSPAVEKILLDKWHHRPVDPDVYLGVNGYYSLQGYDVQYFTDTRCYTIPQHQFTFFLLSL